MIYCITLRSPDRGCVTAYILLGPGGHRVMENNEDVESLRMYDIDEEEADTQSYSNH